MIFINKFQAIEFLSTGPAGDHIRGMGRFELLVGEERDGSYTGKIIEKLSISKNLTYRPPLPVYQQVQSREMKEKHDVLLFRLDK